MSENGTCNSVKITVARYERLIAVERELELLKSALASARSFDIDTIRNVFVIKAED